MSYTLILYKGVDVQRTPIPENVRLFSNKAEQTSYFQSKQWRTVDDCTPYKDLSVLRVGVDVDDMRTVPYMSFEKDGGKRVYAFVDKVQYVNEETSEIYYTIDSFQTYMFDIVYNDVYIEREHVIDDTIGANIIPENIGTGEYVYGIQKYTGLFNPADYHIILACTENPINPDLNYGKNYCNIYSGVGYYDFGVDYSGLNGFIDNLVNDNKKDAILGIYMCPKDLFNDSAIPVVKSFNIPNRPNDIDGYVPRNNKLFTQPYCMCVMSNGNGQSMNIYYEYLTNTQFMIEFSTGINMEAYCYPNEYKGIANNRLFKLKISNFPMCAFTVDSYQAWLAQNQGMIKSTLLSAATSGLASAGAVAFGAMTGNPVAIAGGLVSAQNSMNKVHDLMFQNETAENLPSVAKQASSGNAEFANGSIDFVSYTCTITAQLAKTIDDYFTRYGYKINEYKTPNLFTRSTFNFIKTVGCNFNGNIPAENMREIQSAFDNGLTLWHTSFTNALEARNEVV